MQEILEYLRSLSPPEREAFAERCHTSVGYLRKAVSTKQQLGVELCIHLDRESGGVLKCERLFPGLDWEYLRKAAQRRADGDPAGHTAREIAATSTNAAPALAHQAPVAINSEAKEAAHA
jgi:DNA-binding transcriptional regulator YdaS (Cro superfamily)